MSDSPDVRPRPEADSSTEEQVRDHGQQLILALSAVIRIARSYQVGNRALDRQLEKIYETLRPVLMEAGEAVVARLDNDMYLNGVRIPVNTANFRFHQTVLEAFARRGVAGLRIQSGLESDELCRFFELFLHGNGAEIGGQALLDACSAAGIRHILPALHATTEEFIDAGAGMLEDLSSGEGKAAETAEPGGHSMASGPAHTNKGPAIVKPKSGLASASRSFADAMLGARSLLAPNALQGGLELRHAKRVIQPLVDSAFASQPVVVGLSSLTHHDVETYAHAVNVSGIAVTMGYFLGMDRRGLADLGVTALLHDVGKNAVADQIHQPLEEFTPEERAAAERHTVEGAKLLVRSTSLNSTTLRCIRVALEHHQAAGSRGFPEFPPAWRVSLMSRIVAAADCFVSLQADRGGSLPAVTPYQALGKMLGPLRATFDAALLWALVQSVGFYPPGQMVELETGFIANVLAPNPNDLARPHVVIVAGADRQQIAAEERRELRPLPHTMSVRRALSFEEYPVEPRAQAA